MKTLEIHQYEGTLFLDEESQTIFLIWATEDDLLEIYTIGSIDRDLPLEIAENMKYMGK